MQKQKGFSLIELLIVVAIILIIAAIAIPNLLRARIASNESSAAASLRTVATAEVTFATSYPNTGYPATLGILGPADAGCTAGPAVTNACIIDFTLGQGAKSGYVFTAAGSQPINGANTQFLTTGVPGSPNTTGVKAFCGVEDKVVRFITPIGRRRRPGNLPRWHLPPDGSVISNRRSTWGGYKPQSSEREFAAPFVWVQAGFDFVLVAPHAFWQIETPVPLTFIALLDAFAVAGMQTDFGSELF